MTRTTEKIRSLFLVALMVGSVFGATVAFSGGAAAASGIGGGSYSTASVAEKSSFNGETVSFNVDDVNLSDGDTDEFYVEIPEEIVNAGSVSVSSATIANQSDASETFANNYQSSLVDGPDSDSVNDAMKVTTGTSSGDASQNLTITFTYSYSTPAVSSDTDYSYTASVVDSDGNDLTAQDIGTDLTVTDSGTGTLNTDKTTDVSNNESGEGPLVFRGQTVAATGFSANEDITLKRGVDGFGGGDDATVRQLQANGDGVVTLDTGDVNTQDANYYFTNGSARAGFEVLTQTLTVEFDDGQADDEGQDSTEEVTFETNRAGQVWYNVTSDDLDDDELLNTVFADSSFNARDADIDDDDTVDDDDGIQIEVARGDYDTDWTDIDSGNYTLDFKAADTTAEDNASINVNDVGTGAASFGTDNVEVAQGGIAEVTINLNDAATGGSGTLVIGNEEDAGYQANITFVDDNDDGEVVVEFNTYTAGMQTSDTVAPGDDDDDVSYVDTPTNSSTDLDSILAQTDYEMAVSTSGSPADTMDDPDNVGTLFIAPRETTGQTIHTAPGSVDWDPNDDGDQFEDDDINQLIEDGAITQDSTIAATGDGNGDYVIHRLAATGLEGMIANSSQPLALGDGVNVTVEETDSSKAPNSPAKVINLSATGFTVVEDPDDGAYYVIIDLEDAVMEDTSRSLRDEDEFEAEITVDDPRLLEAAGYDPDDSDSDIEDFEQVTNATFTNVDREVEFDSDPVQVSPNSGQAISGTTNVAPSSELTMRMRSTEDTQPRFVKTTEEVVVQSDGTFSAEFDFSNQQVGDTFTATASVGSGLSTEVDGEVVEAQTTTTTEPTTSTTEPTTSTTEPTTSTTEPTTSEPTTSEPTDTTSSSSPGFGIAVAVVALLAAALLAYRRD